MEPPHKRVNSNSIGILNTLSICDSLHAVKKEASDGDTVHLNVRMNEYCRLEVSAKMVNPLANPVSFHRSDLSMLRGEYCVLPKANGTRYLMLMCTDRQSRCVVAFMDRTGAFYEASASEYQVGDMALFEKGTVLDCELVVETQFDARATLWVIDVIHYAGNSLINSNYYTRIDSFKLAQDTFKKVHIKAKPYFSKVSACKTWCLQGDNAKKDQYDGYILMPIKKAIAYKSQSSMYKWKPKQTIDLLVEWSGSKYDVVCADPDQLELNYDARRISLSKGHGNLIFEIPPRCMSSLIEKEGMSGSSIFECIIDMNRVRRVEQKHFIECVPDRKRTDKKQPNTIRVVKDTYRMALEDVKESEIDDFILLCKSVRSSHQSIRKSPLKL